LRPAAAEADEEAPPAAEAPPGRVEDVERAIEAASSSSSDSKSTSPEAASDGGRGGKSGAAAREGGADVFRREAMCTLRDGSSTAYMDGLAAVENGGFMINDCSVESDFRKAVSLTKSHRHDSITNKVRLT
jgi:hypothetical protein